MRERDVRVDFLKVGVLHAVGAVAEFLRHSVFRALPRETGITPTLDTISYSMLSSSRRIATLTGFGVG